ncbi:hypothetical protein BCV69DRAFT_19811 [Microstroma glucosiphilum]|uniref:Uncharacterized protein n=1 Tax=Pseudomicrostroma glucosiphilum TaxID=1684307 RepID=A0A316UFJ4_9BASI|nr:hypothetical protein BCV69DRAFT_19811 [Pseudomicrostroma glucosiphilum]PWN24087.1 hypothetical protein BCV69DRAFT_19811 [Pseudomicrostroma glucosiphilum]
MSRAVFPGQADTSPKPFLASSLGLGNTPLQSKSTFREGIKSLQQAANYAPLSRAPLLEPHDITSAMMQLGRSSEDWSSLAASSSSSSRPPMLPRGESTKTISGRGSSRPGLQISTSSEMLTPAARVVNNPFDGATVAERLERKVESPLHPSSDVDTDTESYPSSLATSADSAANSNSPRSLPSRTLTGKTRLHPNYGTPLYRASSPLGRITSPDSWRSLLPEDDPYFAADTEGFDARQSTMLFSDDGNPDRPDFIRQGSGESSSASSAMDGSRRLSSSSSLGSFSSSVSLLPPIAIAAGPNDDWPVDSWRSLLPPSEPTNRRSTASPGPSSVSPSQPSHVAGRDDDASLANNRVAAIAIASRDSNLRRPASFSTFDKVAPEVGHRAQERPETASDASDPASQASYRPRGTTESSVTGRVADAPRSTSLSSSLTSSSSPRRYARTAMDNDDERESWPCSRNYSEQSASPIRTADSPLSFRRHSVQPASPFKAAASRMHDGLTPSSKLKPAVITTSSTALLSSIPGNGVAASGDTTLTAPSVVATTIVTTTTTTGDDSMPSSQSTSSITTSLPMPSPLAHAAPCVPFQ